MAKTFTFVRESDEDLITVTAQLGNTLVELVLDTGASHTFIDFGVLVKEGFRLDDSKGLVLVETANGIIFANRFVVPLLGSLGLEKSDFEITSYLFDDPIGNYRGVIGLDFLEGKEFCIDLKTKSIRL